MIAVFDSGYGGLTVLKPLMDLMPEYDYVYLGDSARAPYGGHSDETIKKMSKEAVDYLFKIGAKLIVFACNTATSTSLEFVKSECLSEDDLKSIVGVLESAAIKAVDISETSIGVVGTTATVNSGAYERKIKELDASKKVHSKACPLLVPFIEEDWYKSVEAKMVLKKYVRPLKHASVDTLILGCTHYPIMKKQFQKVMGKSVTIVDSGFVMAESLKAYLDTNKELQAKLSKTGKREFLTTDDPVRFKKFVEKNFGMKISIPKQIKLV